MIKKTQTNISFLEVRSQQLSVSFFFYLITNENVQNQCLFLLLPFISTLFFTLLFFGALLWCTWPCVISPSCVSNSKSRTTKQSSSERGESRWLSIDWLMLKHFLTKRICKRRVTHGTFSLLCSPAVDLVWLGTVKPLSFHSWLIDRILEES